jgi:hypothetical protein
VVAVVAAYLGFGGWAYLASRDPFFAVFPVPGALLGAAWLMSSAGARAKAGE